jgi:hypothetical protein
MKIKFNILAAAALALASSMASAAINVSSTPDLLLVAYDPATASTYTRDLGVSLSALTTNQTFNAPANSIFASQFTGVATSAIQWNVVALNNVNGSQQSWTTGDISQFNDLHNNDVTSLSGVVTASLGGFTQLDLAANGYYKGNGEYTGVKNGNDQTNGQVFANDFAYGFPVSGNGVGTSQNFLHTANDGTTTQLAVNASLAAFGDGSDVKGGYFTLTDAGGDLTWTTSAVAAVPLPAAVLLFAPALMAMFGIGRRRQSRAA